MRILLPIFVIALTALGVVWSTRPDVTEPATAHIGAEVIIAEPTPISPQEQAFMAPAVQPAHVPLPTGTVSEPVIDANAAIVYHGTSDTTLYTKNEGVRAPIASLTKVLTTMVVDTLLAPEDIVIISSSSTRVDGLKQTLFTDEQIRVRDLVTMMLVESSNDAAYALREHAALQGIDLVAEMNQRARELGMLDSHFTDPAGLDDSAYSTVHDLVRLVRTAQKKPSLWSVMREPVVTVTSVDGSIEHVSENTNQLLATIPTVVWGKTGNTDGALGCMILVMELPERDDTLVSIILGSQVRFADTEHLVNWAQDAWRWN